MANESNDRSLFLYEEVNMESVRNVSEEIIKFNKEDNKKEKKEIGFERQPICLYINSPGGSVYSMWGLIDLIQTSKTPVHTYCMGYAMSAAFNIFLAGKKRFAHRHSTFMYHQLSSWTYSKLKEMEDDIKECGRLDKMIVDYVKSRTNIPAKKLEEIHEKKLDFYMDVDYALKHGIVDEIL